jgi:nicotinamide-nucleotide amidase
VTYSNQSKTDELGVKIPTLKAHGAVSRETASEMAAGALRHSQADIALSITGIAGPGGGTQAVPVGTVYIGLADDVTSTNRRLILPGDRHLIRWRASTAALEMVRRRYLI